MEENGFMFSGTSPDGRLVEIIELKDHPWFVAAQFHPEFTSRPTRPQPLFREFIRASLENKGGCPIWASSYSYSATISCVMSAKL